MSTTVKSEYAYDVLPVCSKDNNAVVEFLLKFFFWDEPLNKVMELMKVNNTEHLKRHSMDLLNKGKSKKKKINIV